MLRSILIATHLFGAVVWAGGLTLFLFAAASMLHGKSQAGLAALVSPARKLVNGGMLLAWAGGLGVLIPNFTQSYARAGWMHSKLTLLLVLSALTGVSMARARKGKAGGIRLFAGAVLVAVGLILVLVELRPF